MTAFVCLIWFYGTTRMTSFEIQNEDAMVLSAKALSEKLPISMACINQFDGQVFWFLRGKQVERP